LVVVLNIEKSPAAKLEDVDDMRRFHVRVDGGSDLGQVADGFRATGLGRFESMDSAQVSADAIRSLAAGNAGPGWDDAFARMIAYAETKGWFDRAAGTISAHCELGP
jgi:hypothetical protein